MKKHLSILIAALAVFPLLTACSDDDDKAPAITIATGEIPAKNVFVTIDGTYIGTPGDGVTELTGTLDPSATEQHLQLSCPSMFIIDINPGYITPFEKIVPVFDITVKNSDGKTTLSGEYKDKGYEISLSGDITRNHKGENDWRLFYVIKENGKGTLSPFSGKTFEIEFTSDDIYTQPTYTGPVLDINPVELTKSIFPRIPEAYTKNSGYSGARISFREDGRYDLWFKDSESGEYIKDESEHRYMCAATLFFIDEPAFIEKQSEMFNLSSAGLNYSCSDMCFAAQKIAYDVLSSKEWCITEYDHNGIYDTTYLFPTSPDFFNYWTQISDSSSQLDGEFNFLKELEKSTDRHLRVYPTVKFHLIEI